MSIRYRPGIRLALCTLALLAGCAGEHGARAAEPLVLRRTPEPNEHAFSILVPEGWRVEGGIVRVDPLQAGGPAQSIEAKLDFAVRRDERGSVELRRYPDWYCIDMSRSPAGQMGMFPPGSNYQGMPVSPVYAAADYLEHVLLPRARGGASGLRVVERGRLDQVVAGYRQRLAKMGLPPQVGFDGASLTVEYEEDGTRYREVFYTVIEDRGPLVGGQWVNRETTSLRAPAAEVDRWLPVLVTMLGSVELDGRWLAGELGGQRDRGDSLLRTQRQVQELGRQIAEHRRHTNAEIMNDAFLTLTEQEEYVNPFSGEIELGTDRLGPNRWETESGDVLYADEEGFDPNDDPVLNRSGWKRSRVRPR